jgi:hypothetical protein
MTDLIRFLNANSGSLNAVFSGVVALATVVYAILTWRLVAETQHLRRAQTDAFVIVALVPNQQAFGFLDLVVRNDGSGPAYDLVFVIRDCTFPELDEKLRNTGFIKRGLKYLPARSDLRTFLTDTFSPQKLNARLTVDVSYRTASHQKLMHSYPLDLALMENVQHVGTPFHQSVPKQLSEIAKTLEQLLRVVDK